MKSRKAPVLVFLLAMGLMLLALPPYTMLIAEDHITPTINFVSIFHDDFGNSCQFDAFTGGFGGIRQNFLTDARRELADGMALGAVSDDFTFRGILRQTTANDFGIPVCETING